EISPETIEHGGDPLFHDGQCDASCMDEPAPVYSTGTWFRRGDWFTIGEFAYWTKDESRKVGIAFDGSVVPDGRIATPSSLSTRDAKHKFEPGLSLTLGRFLGRDAANRDHLFEIHFLGLFQWEGEATIRGLTGPSLDTLLNGGTFGSNRVIVPGQTVAGFTNTDVQSFTYDSDLNNLELNYSVRSRPGRDQMAMQPDGNWVRFKNAGCVKSVLGGLRLMRINELAQYLSRDDVLGTVNTVESGIYRVNTDNDVFGPQIGMDFADSYDEWSWGLRGKVGGLINLTDRRSIVSTTLTTFTNNQPTTTFAERQEHINEEQFAFLAEVGAFGAYQLRPNLYVRAGYDVLFVSGLAVAPENMALAPAFMPMNISGDMVYHGGTVGFEALW
ncbi:MAG TPA: BBP7 family outer membrane beta-barrel protein, partial [Pirellulaceae bacterium]